MLEKLDGFSQVVSNLLIEPDNIAWIDLSQNELQHIEAVSPKSYLDRWWTIYILHLSFCIVFHTYFSSALLNRFFRFFVTSETSSFFTFMETQ